MRRGLNNAALRRLEQALDLDVEYESDSNEADSESPSNTEAPSVPNDRTAETNQQPALVALDVPADDTEWLAQFTEEPARTETAPAVPIVQPAGTGSTSDSDFPDIPLRNDPALQAFREEFEATWFKFRNEDAAAATDASAPRVELERLQPEPVTRHPLSRAAQNEPRHADPIPAAAVLASRPASRRLPNGIAAVVLIGTLMGVTIGLVGSIGNLAIRVRNRSVVPPGSTTVAPNRSPVLPKPIDGVATAAAAPSGAADSQTAPSASQPEAPLEPPRAADIPRGQMDSVPVNPRTNDPPITSTPPVGSPRRAPEPAAASGPAAVRVTPAEVSSSTNGSALPGATRAAPPVQPVQTPPMTPDAQPVPASQAAAPPASSVTAPPANPPSPGGAPGPVVPTSAAPSSAATGSDTPAPASALASRPVELGATMSENSAIYLVLGRYQSAFNDLNASVAKSVWPSLDERMLARAFDSLERQEVVFDSCQIEAAGSRAVAACRGHAQYVPKVGSRTARVEPRRWTFRLSKAGDGWLIESVESR